MQITLQALMEFLAKRIEFPNNEHNFSFMILWVLYYAV